MKILKTLREDHGFAGGYTVVQEYVRQARDERRQSEAVGHRIFAVNDQRHQPRSKTFPRVRCPKLPGLSMSAAA